MQPFISVPSLKNQSLKDLTTWRIGGYSTEVFFPATIEEIQRIVVHYRMLDRPLSVMGYGSNLLIDDRGFDGGIIVLKKNFCKHTLDHTDLLVLEAGFACPKLARLAWTMGFKNLAFLSGIPGSIGGAIQMNAGAHHHAIMDYVKKVEMIDTYGNIHLFDRSVIEASYRQTHFPIKGIVTRAWIALEQEGLLSLTEVLAHRSRTQPLAAWSCGSVFKNPHATISAGWLIEQVGLKGFVYNELEISVKHANFMLNTGNASSQDVLTLTRMIQQRVYLLTGYILQPEYQTLGSCF